MSGECQVNVKSQSELDIGGRETCYFIRYKNANLVSSRYNSFVDYSFNIHLHGYSYYLGHMCVLEKVLS